MLSCYCHILLTLVFNISAYCLFQLKYSEIYTVREVLKFPLPRTWKDMKKAHETVIGFLNYEVCIYGLQRKLEFKYKLIIYKSAIIIQEFTKNKRFSMD